MSRPALPTKKFRFFTSTVPASTETSADQYNNEGYVGLQVDIAITVLTGTSVTLTIQGKNEDSGVYYTVLADAAHTIAEDDRLIVDPRITTVTANFSVAVPVPRIWRISVAKSAVTALTMYCDAQYNN